MLGSACEERVADCCDDEEESAMAEDRCHNIVGSRMMDSSHLVNE